MTQGSLRNIWKMRKLGRPNLPLVRSPGHWMMTMVGKWKWTVDDLVNKGKLRNCLAVCDVVSDKRKGHQMEVSVGMGVLVSWVKWRAMGREADYIHWKSWASESEMIFDQALKLWGVRTMDSGMDTDFQGVFDIILQVAVKKNLEPEQMIKEAACVYWHGIWWCAWETDFQEIVNKYTMVQE